MAERPGWIEGQARLAEMRAETREPGDFARGYAEALARDPANRALHEGHWRALARAGRHRDAIDAMDRAGLPEDAGLRLIRAAFLIEAGEAARARDLLRELSALQAGLLRGGPDPAGLQRLAALAEGEMPPDPVLADALAGIALRARIELARRER